MNRTLLLLLAVLLLGGFTYWATTSAAGPEKVSDRSPDRQFGYANFDEDVHRIFIADRKGHQTTLTRGGITGWLTDGQPANEHVMNSLRDAVMNLEVITLPTQKAKANMIKRLASEGILVQLFDEQDNKLRGYYIGGGTANEIGTMAIVEGSEEPYVVSLPHFTGNVRVRFGLWGDEWRDKVYFRIDPDKVESFSIDYPRQRNRSFRLTKTNGKFQVAPFYETGQPVKSVAAGRAEGILSKFEKYYVSSYENMATKAKEYAKTVLPFATLTIKQKGQAEQTLKVYPRIRGEELVDDGKGNVSVQKAQITAYNGLINDDADWVLLHQNTLEPLLVSYQSF